MTSSNMGGWEEIHPTVNAEAEFFEIVNDFGDPIELLREAISNSMDWHATWVRIEFNVEEIEGSKRLVITISDDGDGMTREVLMRDFWGLGFSPARGMPGAIGEKGHGTKIYLRSERVVVRTHSSEGAFESECTRPVAALSQKRLHQPRCRRIENPWGHTGTEIRIIGYNDNERSRFVQGIVKDHLLWFTRLGSVELVFGIRNWENFKVYLKCLDRSEFEEIAFGHPFPEEDSDINKLFKEKGESAADWYVKRHVWTGERLRNHPEVTFDAVISVEGDGVKRKYNPMIGQRRRSETGRYRVGDRYGIWLCKDYIPVVRVNDWITGFGSGSNAFVLLHGFVNCQHLKLTANRGDVANTDPTIYAELKDAVQELINDVDAELSKKGLYVLRDWQQESITLQQEQNDFTRRVKSLKGRPTASLDRRLLIEPRSESEFFGLFTTLRALRPDLFEFEPLDYNTNRGIDMIARNTTGTPVEEGEHSYVELKYMLQGKQFNHSFKHLRWIVCWDFDRGVGEGTELQGIEETDTRSLRAAKDEGGRTVYFLESPVKARKVQVLRLREFLRERLQLELQPHA
ncbi:MAG: ATP-binding protein [bacterium]|nr:ATP-binding protein [bacterium]